MGAAVGKPGAGARRATRPAPETTAGEQAVKSAVSTIARHKTSADNKNTRLDGDQDNGDRPYLQAKFIIKSCVDLSRPAQNAPTPPYPPPPQNVLILDTHETIPQAETSTRSPHTTPRKLRHTSINMRHPRATSTRSPRYLACTVNSPPHPLTCFVTPCMYYMHRRSERRGDCSVLGIRTSYPITASNPFAK
jgi:hypothetical protein